ncbi:MAG: PIG-L family deacetylase [Actinomycetota bacterium]|nr:PIG-L family deacetylase [Actinomycetota bacterium]
MVTFDANGPGTPSAVWHADGRAARVPNADLSAVKELIVIAPHPDDETLGCGGLIAGAAHLGVKVQIIVVTDGSASHPRSKTVKRHELRARRAEELREAVTRLDPGATVTWLGFPDGRTADFEDAIQDRLQRELQDAGAGTTVAVTWSGDGHRDHRIVGAIVERALPAGPTLWNYPIWMWHWATPDDTTIPWERAIAVALSPEDLDRKRHAINAFESQVHPLSAHPGDERVLEPGVIKHFVGDREVFFVSSARKAVRT